MSEIQECADTLERVLDFWRASPELYPPQQVAEAEHAYALFRGRHASELKPRISERQDADLKSTITNEAANV